MRFAILASSPVITKVSRQVERCFALLFTVQVPTVPTPPTPQCPNQRDTHIPGPHWKLYPGAMHMSAVRGVIPGRHWKL